MVNVEVNAGLRVLVHRPSETLGLSLLTKTLKPAFTSINRHFSTCSTPPAVELQPSPNVARFFSLRWWP